MSEKVEEKVKKVGLFDFLSDLSYDKKYLFSDETEKEFTSFMINRGMSQHADLIMIANEMNKSSNLPKLMVHDFYFHIVKSKKRYGQWAKANKDSNEKLELLMKHYKINRTVAESYLKLLTDEQIKALKLMYNVGGRK